MLVAYLQTCSEISIAKNFLGCIEFYGKEFDPKTTGIYLYLEPKYTKISKESIFLTDFSPFSPLIPLPEKSPFYLFDKLRFDRNLGHTTTKIDQILAEFSKMSDYFTAYRQCLETVVTHHSWLSVQSVDYNALNASPELQIYKNKNLFDEILNGSKSWSNGALALSYTQSEIVNWNIYSLGFLRSSQEYGEALKRRIIEKRNERRFSYITLYI